MKFPRIQTYSWRSSRLTASSGRCRCSRARWLWLQLLGWPGCPQKWLGLLRPRWWEGVFCHSGSCLWYGLRVGGHSRTWPCRLPSTPAGRGTSPSCLSAELLQVTEQLSAIFAKGAQWRAKEKPLNSFTLFFFSFLHAFLSSTVASAHQSWFSSYSRDSGPGSDYSNIASWLNGRHTPVADQRSMSTHFYPNSIWSYFAGSTESHKSLHLENQLF